MTINSDGEERFQIEFEPSERTLEEYKSWPAIVTFDLGLLRERDQ